MLSRVALAGACAAALAAAVAAPSASAAPLRYVALGDSYSAASGVLPVDPSAPAQCLRSTNNYPHLIAKAIGAELNDKTCGAAETQHFFKGQYAGVAPQLDNLKTDTQLVTLTIGGNDGGVFFGTVLRCGTVALTTLTMGQPCTDLDAGTVEKRVLDVTYPDLVRTLKAIKDRSPSAQVGILGYPWIMPETVGCFDKMPVAQGDVPYLRRLQATLNDAVKRAAAATGATYVDLNEVSNGHDACSKDRWIEPVLQGTNPVIVHPNATGEAAMAAQALKVLDPLNPKSAPAAAKKAKLRITKLRKRNGRYSVLVSATGAKVKSVKVSLQRTTAGGKHPVVGRRTVKKTVGPKGLRVQLPKTRKRTAYRIVVTGLNGTTKVRRTLSFRSAR